MSWFLGALRPMLRAGGGHSFGGGSGGHSSGGGGGGVVDAIVLVIIVVVVLVAAVIAIVKAIVRATTKAVEKVVHHVYPGPQPEPGDHSTATDGSTAVSACSSGGGEADPETPPPGAQPTVEGMRNPRGGSPGEGGGDLLPGTAPAGGLPQVGDEKGQGLAAITGRDPAFDLDAFLEQCQPAFFVVQEAWSEREPELSRQVMSDGLWQQHRVQIQGYLDEHKRNVLGDLAVGGLDVVSAHSDASYDTIVVRVTAACSDYDVDDAGKVVRGDKRVEQWAEEWTFQRSAKATTKPGGGTLAQRCPNCGAPLSVDIAGVCSYCRAPVMSGDYDWPPPASPSSPCEIWCGGPSATSPAPAGCRKPPPSPTPRSGRRTARNAEMTGSSGVGRLMRVN